MYAVFEDGSRQYRVSEGDQVRLDFRDVPTGSQAVFDRVLLYASGEDTQIGQPTVAGMRVVGEVFERPLPGAKIKRATVKTYIQKFRRRKNYRRFTGHRQPYVHVRITNILQPGQEVPPKPAPAPAPAGEPPAPQQ